jgi:hypothetical protein
MREHPIYAISLLKGAPMTKAVSIGGTIMLSFLFPGNTICKAFGLDLNQDLVPLLVNSLVWTLVGIFIVVFAV